jgi:NADH:flavin oxidoreductase / NADH oxidase family
MARTALFTPVQIGAITLKHRVVMPPLSRLRAQWPSGVPSDLNLEYYSQRASDGGLIFTDATAISATGRGYRGAPGIYSDEQVAGWKRVTDAVHAKGGRMFVQLWHAGRTTHIATTGEEPVTASVDPPSAATAVPDPLRTFSWRDLNGCLIARSHCCASLPLPAGEASRRYCRSRRRPSVNPRARRSGIRDGSWRCRSSELGAPPAGSAGNNSGHRGRSRP